MGGLGEEIVYKISKVCEKYGIISITPASSIPINPGDCHDNFSFNSYL